jgi:hypothetical protein
MKTNARRHMPKQQRKQKAPGKKMLEETYRKMFTAPAPQPTRERLTMYKPVPSTTTYGLS